MPTLIMILVMLIQQIHSECPAGFKNTNLYIGSYKDVNPINQFNGTFDEYFTFTFYFRMLSRYPESIDFY
jgi:hypothetical protein